MYDWKSDIHDVEDDLAGEELDQAFFEAGRHIVEEDPDEYAGYSSLDDAAIDEAANIVNLPA